VMEYCELSTVQSSDSHHVDAHRNDTSRKTRFAFARSRMVPATLFHCILRLLRSL
jgi:hypothetical protein